MAFKHNHVVPVLTSQQIRTALAPYGLELTAAHMAQVAAYLDLLLRWNRRINLTSVRDPGEILRRHFGESFYLAMVLPLSDKLLVDVGSGAGFPGLALKIICPGLRVVLVESVGKKIAFLKEVSRELNLSPVEFEQDRFERVVAEWKRKPADVVTARAVGKHAILANNAARILRPSGRIAFFLGREDAQSVVRETRQFRWEDCRLLPTAANRVILLGTKA